MPARSEPAIQDDARVGQLTRDLADATERQEATNQVLEIIGRSEFELQAVFETVLRHAVRLCDADTGVALQPDGDLYRVAFAVGASQEWCDYVASNPIVQGP